MSNEIASILVGFALCGVIIAGTFYLRYSMSEKTKNLHGKKIK